jgi:ABC-2 type transport system permease protein
MSAAGALGEPSARRRPFVHQLQILRVVAGSEYKLKYAESALGYLWSIAKPLAMFAVLYTVFGRFFKLSSGIEHYPLYLLIGLVVWIFFVDASTLAMSSLVARASLLRKLSFPYLVIPVSVTVTAAMTFLVNLVVVAVFVLANHISPTWSWLWIPPLLLELFVFTLGVGLVLATAFVRLRDLGQLWELLVQLLFYGSPIMYPVGFLPPWAKPIAFIFPVVQVMQDLRSIIVGGTQSITAADVYHTAWAYAIPLGFCAVVVVFGLWIFERESPWFAERV